VYATVEEFTKGFATVRLATKGARMTNLPVLTASVAPGDRVVVDYSAEGQPYVRPLTALPTEAGEPTAVSAPEESEDMGIIAAKIGRDSRYPFETYYYSPSGFGYDVHKQGLPWNKVYWQTQDDLVQTEWGGDLVFRAPEDGKYLVKWCIGIETQLNNSGHDNNVQVYIYSRYFNGLLMNFVGGRRHIRYSATQFDGTDVVVSTGSTLVQLSPNENGWIEQSVDCMVQVEVQGMPWFSWDDPKPWVGRDTAFAYKEGCYPVIEIYKIAQTGNSLEANYDHIWWQYWD
jgi:hypothetical protein